MPDFIARAKVQVFKAEQGQWVPCVVENGKPQPGVLELYAEEGITKITAYTVDRSKAIINSVAVPLKCLNPTFYQFADKETRTLYGFNFTNNTSAVGFIEKIASDASKKQDIVPSQQRNTTTPPPAPPPQPKSTSPPAPPQQKSTPPPAPPPQPVQKSAPPPQQAKVVIPPAPPPPPPQLLSPESKCASPEKTTFPNLPEAPLNSPPPMPSSPPPMPPMKEKQKPMDMASELSMAIKGRKKPAKKEEKVKSTEKLSDKKSEFTDFKAEVLCCIREEMAALKRDILDALK